MAKKGMRFSQEEVNKMIKERRARYADAELRKINYPVDLVLADAAKKKRPKYGNEAQIVDGIRMPSKKEAEEYKALNLRLKAGEFPWLARQVQYILTGGIIYVADFQHPENNNPGCRILVKDAKGVRTEGYRLKKKLMLSVHGIDIIEL